MKQHQVLGVERLGDRAFILRLERKGLRFAPGQHILVGIPGHLEQRPYSLFSSPSDAALALLITAVPGGDLSWRLRRLGPGDRVTVDGPQGDFCITDDVRGHPLLFVASGTGIAPFHSFVTSTPSIDYTILHGVRRVDHGFGVGAFEEKRYISCVSRGDGGRFRGRVTDYLSATPCVPWRYCFLCGGTGMIFDTFALLTSRGVPRERIFAEVYF